MTTKYNIGDSVCLYDFDDEKVIFGTIMGIQAYASKQCRTELGDVFMQVEINYDVDCVDYKYERKEKHLFKSVEECKAYYIEHIRSYDTRHNTLFGRGMSETTQVLSLSRLRGVHDRAKTSIHRATLQGVRV